MFDSKVRAAVRYGVAAAATALGVLASANVVSAQTATPTFTKDVAPIFQDKCEACHRPDSIAPMSLVTYEEARPWARSIKTRVASRQMPPWHIDRTVGIQHFQNDRSLTDEQIATIVAWVDGGAPKGSDADMPAPKQWPDESIWNYAERFGGPPDLIVKSPLYTQAARGQDTWFKPTVPSGLDEPRWVRAIEIRPSTVKGRKITHHALAFLQQDETGATYSGPQPLANVGGFRGGTGLFMEWAVGKEGEVMRPDSGKLMLPGSSIHFDIHYSSAGEEITDAVELGIYFYPKGEEPKYRQVLSAFSGITGGNQSLDIKPNSVYVGQDFHVMRENGRVENFQAHMHLRGKAMMLEAILPTGQVQVLSHVNNFNFNWHNNYVYADDAAPLLPKGTILRVTSWHDNTAANPSNPDPSQWVGWGDRTVDEMAHAWINITYMKDEDFQAEVAKREASRGSSTQQQQQQ